MKTAEQRIAQDLLAIQAVSLQPNAPFTWASGLKSPIYCDQRITLGYPKIRQAIATDFVAKIQQHFPEVEVIAGTATAGIPHAAWIAQEMALPMVYIRSQAKAHGKGKQIEGRLEKGQKMVIIEDLISTGKSVLQAAEAARNEGADVLGVAAIFTYELPVGQANFAAHNLPLVTLTNLTTLLSEASEQQYINENERYLLEKWRKDPTNWQANEKETRL